MSVVLKNRLAECLRERRIKRSQLARRLRMSRAYVTRLMQGKIAPSLAVALRIARYFGRPVEEIFELPDAVPPASLPFPASLGSVGELTKNNAETLKGKSTCN